MAQSAAFQFICGIVHGLHCSLSSWKVEVPLPAGRSANSRGVVGERDGELVRSFTNTLLSLIYAKQFPSVEIVGAYPESITFDQFGATHKSEIDDTVGRSPSKVKDQGLSVMRPAQIPRFWQKRTRSFRDGQRPEHHLAAR